MEMEYFNDNLLWQYDKTELYVFVLVLQGHARAFEEQLKKCFDCYGNLVKYW